MGALRRRCIFIPPLGREGIRAAALPHCQSHLTSSSSARPHPSYQPSTPTLLIQMDTSARRTNVASCHKYLQESAAIAIVCVSCCARYRATGGSAAAEFLICLIQ